MNFKAIQDEIINARFNENQRASVKYWINLRYAQIWAMAEWPWKFVGPTTLSIVADDQTPVLPADIDIPYVVFDDVGNVVQQMDGKSFDISYRYSEINNDKGKPQAYKWLDNVLTLAPIPNTNYTFSLTYLRRLASKTQAGALQDGPMVADTDTPIWDSNYDYMLVLGAMATGLKVENDPTWQPLQNDFELFLDTMREEYLPSLRVSETLSYGPDFI